MNTKDTKEYLYVMDFSDSTFSEIELKDENEEVDTEELLKKYGFNEDECYFMFTTKRITEINKIKID